MNKYSVPYITLGRDKYKIQMDSVHSIIYAKFPVAFSTTNTTHTFTMLVVNIL